MSQRTVRITPAEIAEVESAYEALYAIATSEDPKVADGRGEQYLTAQAAFNTTARRVTGIRKADTLATLRDHLCDNAGFPNSLPRILRHMGYKVEVVEVTA